MKDNQNRKNKIIVPVLSIALAAVLVLCIFMAVKNYSQSQTQTQSQSVQAENIFDDDVLQNSKNAGSGIKYDIEQMLIISRHNIRSTLSDGDSELSKITPHKWFDWTSKAGELSLKGGQMETIMGQYFRKFLEADGFIPENWQPNDGEVRFYANSMQRTIATARFFAAGMIPTVDTHIEYHKNFGEVDPIFCPIIRNKTPQFEKQVRKEINEFGGDDGLVGIGRSLKESYELLENLIDFKDSEYAKENGIEHFPTDDIEIELNEGEEVKVSGGLSLVNSAVDALKLQIYEQPDLDKSLFGHKVSAEELQKICKPADVYQKICEGSKTLSTQVMKPMLTEMKKEFNTSGRKFTFFCGHDSTLAALAAALDVKEYELPGAISQKTPIGAKMLFEKYLGDDGKYYMKVRMCYNSTDQLRNSTITTLDNSPAFYELEFEGLKKNEDGFYSYDDIMSRFDESIAHYYDYCKKKEHKKAA